MRKLFDITRGDRLHQLRNYNCVYCNADVRIKENRRKEHAVGKRFVPTGTLNGSPNLICFSCVGCNLSKSDLENDISAISLLSLDHDHMQQHGPEVLSDVARKIEGAASRLSGTLVRNSWAKTKAAFNDGNGFEIVFTFTGPPQIDEWRIVRLSHFHVQAFFYYITFNSETRKGGFIPGDFQHLATARQSDWGNEAMITFMAMTKSWSNRFIGVLAQGYFKISIKRKDDETPLWSWALEWNKNLRTVGFFGSQQLVDSVARQIPQLDFDTVASNEDYTLAHRRERKISPSEDSLFDFPSENEEPI